MTRRGFLACGAASAGALALGVPGALAEDAPTTKPKIRLVFPHRPPDQATWPNIGYDYEGRKKELAARLREACPDVEFLPATALSREDAVKIVQADAEVDGYLVYLVGIWTSASEVCAKTGKPTLFVDDLYAGSGEFLIQYANCRRQGLKVVGVSTAKFEDVAAVARCFGMLKKPGVTADDWFAAAEAKRRAGLAPMGDMACPADDVKVSDVGKCLEALKADKMLVVGRGNSKDVITNELGITMIPIGFAELDAAYSKADRDEAAACADRWIKGAEKVVEPSRECLVDCGAMYLGMKALMAQHGAEAITINCLGGFYGGHMKAYPCMGFFQFNNDGLVGACEADTNSTTTMMVMRRLTDRPGYISDPVVDTSTNQIIYAHCVASSKVFGPQGPSNPYHIRDHSEDRKGACVRSLMPLGRMTTTLEFAGKRVVLHQAKTVANIDEDKACRTKLAADLKGDMAKLLDNWAFGWHRVTVYGDVLSPVKELAKAVGFEVVEEA
jgi:hypothetical protein